MSEAKTLLQLAGANLAPAKLSEAAVVIIDAQDEYVSGKLPLDGVGAALDRIATLLKAAREAGAPVIHIAQRGRPGGLFDPDAVCALWHRHLSGKELWTVGKIAPIISLELTLRALWDDA